MSAYDQLKWAVAHDPCRAGDRSPLGAVPVGTCVEVRLRVDETVFPLVESVDVLVFEREALAADAASQAVPMHEAGGGFAGAFSLRDDPHVAFYLFALTAVGGEAFYYVPCADGRSTAGELVREGADGVLDGFGWRYSDGRRASHPVGDLALQELTPGFQITVFEPAFASPAWAAGAIMYQIFPDRFARGSGGVRQQGLVYHERMGRPVRLHASWDEPVEWEGGGGDGGRNGGESESAPYDPVDFFGGTLAGIREKLPYLASLGVEAVYLNPVFEARSNHRYDTADYERVDPLLGDAEELCKLAKAADEQGIAFVLDAVLSHTGDDSRYFDARGSYEGPGAMQDAASPYRSWYDFTNPTDGAAYRCWWGYPSLPEVNERDESWQAYMLGRWYASPRAKVDVGDVGDADVADVGVLGAWLGVGVRGYRLDVADEIPDDVLERIRASVKRADPEALIIGEVWEDATTKASYGMARTYALGRSLDSVMNYPLRSALVGFALGVIDAHHLATFLKQQKANYPPPLYACLMNLLSTHDVERVRTVLALGGQVKHLPRDEQLAIVKALTPEQDAEAARMQRMIVSLLYALPGMPCVYYGDERGLHGGGDPFCRATFPWECEMSQNTPGVKRDISGRLDCGIDLTGFYRAIGAIRKDSPALRTGAFACIAPDSDVICVFRYDAKRKTAVVVAANRSEIPRRVAIDLFSPSLSLPPAAQRALRSALLVGSSQFCSEAGYGEIERITCEGGIVHLTVPPSSTTYWQAEA